MRVNPYGPTNAKIAIVGEAPGTNEAQAGLPFIGQSGQELTRMLAEAGIDRNDCYITNIIKTRPPGNDIEHFITKKKKLGIANKWPQFYDRWVSPEALADIQETRRELAYNRPNVILALGETSLWALSGRSGITSWRGSILAAQLDATDPIKLIPTYHPATVLRQWDWRWITVQDMRRTAAQSGTAHIPARQRNFIVNPDFGKVTSTLHNLITKANNITDAMHPMQLAIDIETINHNIACVGIAWSQHSAICVPLYTSRHYYTAEQEEFIVEQLRQLMTHPKVMCIFQNGFYDIQYFAYFWGFVPTNHFDTMIAHHVAFAGLPKSLDFLASMYCDNYVYWKDELKDYRSAPDDDIQFFTYNCDDCCYTFEVYEMVCSAIDKFALWGVYHFQMRHLSPAVLRMMIRGIRIDKKKREEFAMVLWEKMAERQQWLDDVVGEHLNIRSPKQMQKFFYEDMKIKPIISRKTGNATTDDEALKRIGQRDLLLKPIVNCISDLRSLNVYYSTFVQAQLDPDGRMRCSYNPAGTTTYRFNSSENAFGRGMNLQNAPSEDKDRKAKEAKGEFVMPNIRDLFIPDPGFIITDWDLDRADLQVVVWEADDKDLKLALREGLDIHIVNGIDLFGLKSVPFDELKETHPNYDDHKARFAKQRQVAKMFCHGTNYGGSAYTMAANCGVTVKEAEEMQNRWFGAHPGIKIWHDETAKKLSNDRFVTNKFGYRRFFFDRIDSVLPEALAWIPQSTVACVINRGLVRVDEQTMPSQVQLLLQVHDSVVLQIRETVYGHLLPKIKDLLTITIPYEDKLIIPVGCKASPVSWGQVKRVVV